MTKTATDSTVASAAVNKAFHTVARSMIGRHVTVTGKDGQSVQGFVFRLSTKMGKMKNGMEAKYVIVAGADKATLVELHPNVANTLFNKGAADKYTLQDTVEPIDTKAKEPKEARVTKKSQTVAIFTAGQAGGQSRADIIKTMQAELGLSDACANTYYQNCKSGAWTA